MPPIRNAGLLEVPGGSVMIPRSQWSRMEESRYDIVDRRGRLVAFLVIPAEERVVGFGKLTIYIAATDDDGIERLRKHPWP